MLALLPIIMTMTKPIKFHYQFHSSHIIWLIIFVVSSSLQLFGWVDSWRFNRTLVEQGEIWRLLSGHIVHLNSSHWLLNMAGLAIVAFFFSPHASAKQWLLVILVSAFVISAGLWWWMADIYYYVGLSGVLHGLFLYGALREIRYYPVSGYVLLVVLVAKLLWEFFYGALPGSEDMAGGRVLTEAHLLGAVGGVLVWVSGYLYSRFAVKAG